MEGLDGRYHFQLTAYYVYYLLDLVHVKALLIYNIVHVWYIYVHVL